MEPAWTLPAVEYAERSDPGRDPDKQVNEDACGHRETRFGHLCVVCDGMGGHAAGREAAELALSTIFEAFDRAPEGDEAARTLRAAVEEASRRVHGMHSSEVAFGRPGSTVVAVLMDASGTQVAHVGDSRAYWVHQGQIFRITRDHSIVQELVDRGVLTAQQAAHHPDANRITRALGMGPEVEVEIRPQPVHHVAGDTFVLCSDGLSDLVEDSEIAEVIGNHPAAQAVGKLVDLANARGGHDNITVVVLRARESALAAVGAITPTVVQTAVAQDSATVPASAPTVVDAPQRTVHAHSLASRPLEPTPPPLSSVRGSSPRGKLMVVAGLTLAAIAIALISTVIAAELAELRGKRNSSHTTSAPEFGIPPDAGGDAPSPLLPESVVIPMPSTPPGGSIAPLESSSAGPPRRRRVQ